MLDPFISWTGSWAPPFSKDYNTLSDRPIGIPSSELPEELQMRILEQTDLVAPRDLVWKPESGYHCLAESKHFHPYGFQTCAICRGAFETCCSSLKRGAFDWQCNCWKPLGALFLVNRKTRMQAIQIFIQKIALLFLSVTNSPWSQNWHHFSRLCLQPHWNICSPSNLCFRTITLWCHQVAELLKTGLTL